MILEVAFKADLTVHKLPSLHKQTKNKLDSLNTCTCIEDMGNINIYGLYFQATQDTIGFVGLGNMGNHMAYNGHSREPDNVAFMISCPLCTG
jgi:hypothetical protein